MNCRGLKDTGGSDGLPHPHARRCCTVDSAGLVKHGWLVQGYLAAMSASSYSYVSMLQHFGPLLRPNGAAVSLTYIASERTIPGLSMPQIKYVCVPVYLKGTRAILQESRHHLQRLQAKCAGAAPFSSIAVPSETFKALGESANVHTPPNHTSSGMHVPWSDKLLLASDLTCERCSLEHEKVNRICGSIVAAADSSHLEQVMVVA